MQITSLEQVDADTVRVTLSVDVPAAAFVKTVGGKKQKRDRAGMVSRLKQHLKGLVK